MVTRHDGAALGEEGHGSGLSAPPRPGPASRSSRAMPRCAVVAALLATMSSDPAAAVAADGPAPWSEHRALVLPIPMTVVGAQSIPAGTAQEYFGGLAALGFDCTAEDNTRRRMRRVRVACSHGSTTLLYEGGFPVGYGSVVFDRVQRDGDLLGGAALVAHVRSVAPVLGAEPEGGARAVAEAHEASGGPDR
jgi:hypothetical protein